MRHRWLPLGRGHRARADWEVAVELLAWTFTPPDGTAIRGFPDRDGGSVQTPQGTVPVPPGCLVQVVHPVLVTAGELGELRRLREHLRIIQPVRQLWRQTYQLTAAERDADLYTERCAGHILWFG
jgi:hypothetical protein